ncbi:MAG: hypothetical protein NT163_08095 [Chlorobiales bacterium]|nr:hypothetical protein [Chlorobiales bacterium]
MGSINSIPEQKERRGRHQYKGCDAKKIGPDVIGIGAHYIFVIADMQNK